MYKVKHVPSGLYYQPHKHRGSNLSVRGKVYQTATHGLSEAFRRLKDHPDKPQFQIFYVYARKDSPIQKKYANLFTWQDCTSDYWQVKAATKVTDWIIEEIK
jgi:hypothetical protein